MPRESSKCREWEKDRRNRLNEAFTKVSKLLPCYDPSSNPSKIEILKNAASHIEELQAKIKTLLSENSDESVREVKGEEYKKLQERVKRLLNKNEQLCTLLRNAKITIPAGCSLKKFKFPNVWSHKILPEQAKIMQKKEAEKENDASAKKTQPRKFSGKKQTKVGGQNTTPKHRKAILNRADSKKLRPSKKKKGKPLTPSKCVIVLSQPSITPPCYVIANASSNNILGGTSTVITNSGLVTNPLVSAKTTKTVSSIPPLGPGTLILADGTIMPVLPQQTVLPLAPQIITRPPIILLKNSVNVPVSTPKVGGTGVKTVARIKPKYCLTKTTQVNKVPIPALTSRYSNVEVVLKKTEPKNVVKVVEKKPIPKEVEKKQEVETGEKRKAVPPEGENEAKKAKVVEDGSKEKPQQTEVEVVPNVQTEIVESTDKSTKRDEVRLEAKPKEKINEPEPKKPEETLDLNINHSELSNDIFASLQVPAGCQNPESTSPTAAFLLAFPLVSSLTGVKVTEVTEEDNTESQRGTPTLLQIGTMDSTKPTQSETLTPSLLNLDNLSFFSSKDIGGFYNSFEGSIGTTTATSTVVSTTTAGSKTSTVTQVQKEVQYQEQQHRRNQPSGSGVQQPRHQLQQQPLQHKQPQQPHQQPLQQQSIQQQPLQQQQPQKPLQQQSQKPLQQPQKPLQQQTLPQQPQKPLQQQSQQTLPQQPQQKLQQQTLQQQPQQTIQKQPQQPLQQQQPQQTLQQQPQQPIQQQPHQQQPQPLQQQPQQPLLQQSQQPLQQQQPLHQQAQQPLQQSQPQKPPQQPTQQPHQQKNQLVPCFENHSMPPFGATDSTNSMSQPLSYQPKPVDTKQQPVCANSYNQKNFSTFNTTCSYGNIKCYPEPLYTNSSTYTYSNTSDSNFNQNYYKDIKGDNRNYYSLNYENYADYRKNDSNAYFPTSNYYPNSKSNTNTNSNQKTKNGTTQSRPPINWMTTPDNRLQTPTDYVLPQFTKESDFYPTNTFTNTQTTYFNTNPMYSTNTNDVGANQERRKNLDLSLVPPVNTYQRNEVEDNQFSWSPTKIPQFLDPPHTFVSSTLPTLVGDLALGNPLNFGEQKGDKCQKKDARRLKNYEGGNQSFLSVSQLVDHNKEAVPARTTTRRNSGNRSSGKKVPQKTSQRKETKEVAYQSNKVETPGKGMKQLGGYSGGGTGDIFCDSSQKNRNVTKNSYSAEALIGHQMQSDGQKRQQNYNNKPISVSSFLHDNIIPYFPTVDLPQDNTYIQQNQNYQTSSFTHNFPSTFQNNTYTANTFIPTTTITSTYNFMHEVPAHDYSDLFPPMKEKICAKGVARNAREQQCPPTPKKSKRKHSNDLPGFVDFPFLSMPGSINSPILPDDFHTHTSFLQPPTPQLYPCKNPFTKPNDLTSGSLLPLPPVPGTRSNIQHPEISPSINSAGTSLTNFNLSTIFPEINNKGGLDAYSDGRVKENRSYTSTQVTFNDKPTFSFSYINTSQSYNNQ